MEINDGSTVQRFNGPGFESGDYGYSTFPFYSDDSGNLPSIPGPFTSTAITVKFHTITTQDFQTNTDEKIPNGKGFLASICCSAHVTTNVTSGRLGNLSKKSVENSTLGGGRFRTGSFSTLLKIKKIEK